MLEAGMRGTDEANTESTTQSVISRLQNRKREIGGTWKRLGPRMTFAHMFSYNLEEMTQ